MKRLSQKPATAAGSLFLLVVLLATSAWARPAEDSVDLRIAEGTNSMLFQVYMQPDASSYPGGFAFAMERRMTEKVGVRAGSNFQAFSITSKDREYSLDGGEGDRYDRDYTAYAISITGLMVYHFRSTGHIQASLAAGPMVQFSNVNSTYTYRYSNTPGETEDHDNDQTYAGFGGQVVLDVQWRLTSQISLLGSYGYRAIRTSTDRETKYTDSGPIQYVDGYKLEGHRWNYGTAGATLGLVYHF